MLENNEQIQKIPINLIDDPVNPMRSDVWDESLDELCASIKTHGLIQPITVQKKGERFEVVAGHRRLSAHRKLALSTVDCVVREMSDDEAEIIKVEENLVRLDVNPVDQADHLKKYVEKNNLSLNEISERFNRSRQWVETRLEIATYPEYLKDYLRSGSLSMGVAYWLSRIPNEEVRAEYCRLASIQGLSANRAKYWYDQGVLAGKTHVPQTSPDAPNESNYHVEEPQGRCAFCRQLDYLKNLKTVDAHSECITEYNFVLDRSIAEREKDGGVVGPENN